MGYNFCWCGCLGEKKVLDLPPMFSLPEDGRHNTFFVIILHVGFPWEQETRYNFETMKIKQSGLHYSWSLNSSLVQYLKRNIICTNGYFFTTYGSKSKRNITLYKLHVYTTYGWICSLQTQIMRAQKKPGAIINIGSVAGLFPMHYEPIYSGTKGWSLFVVLRNVLKIANLFVVCKLWCGVVILFLKFSEGKRRLVL